MSTLLAIDPGNERSAYVVLREGEPTGEYDIVLNASLLEIVHSTECWKLAIEGVQSFGLPVGKEVFSTCVWVGRFIEAFGADESAIVYRSEVKLHLCGSMRAKDPSIRQALLDRFGPGREKAVGTKRSPGPLHGISSHCWSALAVGVTWWDTKSEVEEIAAKRGED